jgi:hypothetical protein
MHHARLLSTIALVAIAALSGCRDGEQVARSGTSTFTDLTLPSGTTIDVTLGTHLTSETASVGTPWTGTIRNQSIFDGQIVIPTGSSASGTVTEVKPARTGHLAMLDLGLDSITVDGRSYPVRGSMEAIVAGSTRARNLGVIAGGTAAGATAGQVTTDSTEGTVIGGQIGGGAATTIVSQTKGWQVVMKQGTSLTFTTDEAVAVRL